MEGDGEDGGKLRTGENDDFPPGGNWSLSACVTECHPVQATDYTE